MSKPKVFVAKQIPVEVENYIGEHCEYEKWDSPENIPQEELLRRIADKEGILLSGIKIDDTLLNHAPNLKVVSSISVGYNNYDLQAMKAKGVFGTNTPYVLDDSVADLIVGLILTSGRRLAELDRYVKDGRWMPQDDKNLFGVDVHHSTVGIIGMGRIGQVVAKRMKFGFDAEVLYFNRHRNSDAEEKLGVQYCGLEELLGKSDFVVLMTPLSKDTNKLIGRREFELMKPSAFLINASRGQVVDEAALIEALQAKRIAGAGLDVYEAEPVNPSNPLLKMPNVVTLPHLGSATESTRFNMAMLAAENLVKVLLEGTSPNIVPELRPES